MAAAYVGENGFAPSSLAGEVLHIDDLTAIDADPIAPVEVGAQTSGDEINIGW